MYFRSMAGAVTKYPEQLFVIQQHRVMTMVMIQVVYAGPARKSLGPEDITRSIALTRMASWPGSLIDRFGSSQGQDSFKKTTFFGVFFNTPCSHRHPASVVVVVFSTKIFSDSKSTVDLGRTNLSRIMTQIPTRKSLAAGGVHLETPRGPLPLRAMQVAETSSCHGTCDGWPGCRQSTRVASTRTSPSQDTSKQHGSAPG